MNASTRTPIRIVCSGDAASLPAGLRSAVDDADDIERVPATGLDSARGATAAGVDCLVHVVGAPDDDGPPSVADDGGEGPDIPVVVVAGAAAAAGGVSVAGADAAVFVDEDAEAAGDAYDRVLAHVRAAVGTDRTGAPAGADRRLFETVLESIDDAVYAIRRDGTIEYVNERYARMKGGDRESLIGTDIHGLVSDETADRARRERRALERRESDVGVVEYEFTPIEGAPFPAEMRFSFVDGDGPIDRVGVIRDITERTERESLLRRKNERLDEFTTIVSHDLRSPLNVAMGRLRLAREECDSAHLDDVEAALERMESLLEGLLSLAREGAERGERERVSLAAVVTESLGSVAIDADRVRVDTDGTVDADRDRLRQLLENLLRNAVDHGGRDVRVTVGDLDGGFYVEDDGPGIPPETRETVFDAGVSTAADGTGFGLAIVEGIVDAHGWSIDVTTGTTGGARFEITGVDDA